MGTSRWTGAIVVLALMGAYMVYDVASGRGEDDRPITETAAGAVAYDLCRGLVDEHLNFPADAEYSSLRTATSQEMIPTGPDRATWKGAVLAPNAFGVRSRFEFDCYWRVEGELTRVVKLDFRP